MSNSAQVIRPPNTLRMKVGGAFGGIDASAIAKAEEALKAMSAQFGQWLQDEIVKLDKAQSDIRTQGYNAQTAEALYFRAHDLKGIAGTIGDATNATSLTSYGLPRGPAAGRE